MTSQQTSPQTSLRARAAQGLQVGDSFTLSRCFSDDDIAAFTRISRDYNPVHCDTAYAGLRGFKAVVAHGLLTASLLTEIGGQIGWLAASMNLRFRRPVYVDDVITCHWLITGIDARGRALAEVTMTNQEGIVVLEAQTSGVVPGPDERARLQVMLAQEDDASIAEGPTSGKQR